MSQGESPFLFAVFWGAAGMGVGGEKTNRDGDGVVQELQICGTEQVAAMLVRSSKRFAAYRIKEVVIMLLLLTAEFRRRGGLCFLLRSLVRGGTESELGCFRVVSILSPFCKPCRQRWRKAFVRGSPSPSPLFCSFEGRHTLLLALPHPLPASFNLELTLFTEFDTGSGEI